MLVVSDASPINILVRSGFVELLPALFREVLIPPAVEREMTHRQTPQELREWMKNRPAWLLVQTPLSVDPSLSRDLGEREAISLARERKADLLLVDDQKARRTAERIGLHCVGVLGVMERGAGLGLVTNLREAFARARAQGLWVSDDIVEAALTRDAERHRPRKPEQSVDPARAKDRDRDIER